MKKFNCVLLVDDDEDACFLNNLTLSGADFATHTHIMNDGNNALKFVYEHCEKEVEKELCPDIIFLDISMPVMDGFGFLEKFQKINFKTKKPKIFILTSSNHDKDIEKAKTFDIDAYIVKPLTKPKLKEIMNAF